MKENRGQWTASQWTRKLNCEIKQSVLLCNKSVSYLGPALLSDHSKLEGDRHPSVTLLLLLIMTSIQIMLLWCSLSPRKTKFINLGKQKTLVKDYDILFLQWYGNTWKLIFLETDDRNVVSGKDSAWKLPPPIQVEGTMWTESFMVFLVDVANAEVPWNSSTHLQSTSHFLVEHKRVYIYIYYNAMGRCWYPNFGEVQYYVVLKTSLVKIYKLVLQLYISHTGGCMLD